MVCTRYGTEANLYRTTQLVTTFFFTAPCSPSTKTTRVSNSILCAYITRIAANPEFKSVQRCALFPTIFSAYMVGGPTE